MSANTNRVFGQLEAGYYQYLSDLSHRKKVKTDFYGVEENYLNVTDVNYYVPNDF